jgi:hypothetical protein
MRGVKTPTVTGDEWTRFVDAHAGNNAAAHQELAAFNSAWSVLGLLGTAAVLMEWTISIPVHTRRCCRGLRGRRPRAAAALHSLRLFLPARRAGVVAPKATSQLKRASFEESFCRFA